MKIIKIAVALVATIVSFPAHAVSIVDSAGDILPSFTAGTATPDLDVTSFSVSLDAAATTFSLGAVLAGDINPATPGLYVIGVDTGTGTARPFASIGAPNVWFNQVIIVQKNGTATLGANSLTTLLSGNQFIVNVPVSLLPSTGFAPQDYGFNLWPRTGLGNNNQITDFAPDNALLAVRRVFIPSVPEPASWAMMLLGFGLLGGTMRRQRRTARIAQLA